MMPFFLKKKLSKWDRFNLPCPINVPSPMALLYGPLHIPLNTGFIIFSSTAGLFFMFFLGGRGTGCVWINLYYIVFCIMFLMCVLARLKVFDRSPALN